MLPRLNNFREKDLLQETISKLQNALAKVRDKENDTCDQVKRSLDVAEQAQYEKNAAELEIRRLKDELDRQHAKLRDAISDQVVWKFLIIRFSLRNCRVGEYRTKEVLQKGDIRNKSSN